METFLVITLGKKGEIEDIKLIIPQEKFIVKPKYMNRLLMKKIKKKKIFFFIFPRIKQSMNKKPYPTKTIQQSHPPSNTKFRVKTLKKDKTISSIKSGNRLLNRDR